jgi:hypothetical protein
MSTLGNQRFKQVLINETFETNKKYSVKLGQNLTPFYLSDEDGKRFINDLKNEGLIESIKALSEVSRIYFIK